jgi:uncharacterized membrane protein YedE/YeeE
MWFRSPVNAIAKRSVGIAYSCFDFSFQRLFNCIYCPSLVKLTWLIIADLLVINFIHLFTILCKSKVSMNTKQYLTVFISGLLFGLGLGFSQMIDRGRVIGFLDLAGVWDPTLLFVLGGAVTVTLISFRFVLKLPHPLLDDKFYLPTQKNIDSSLVVGSAIFGIGWGISGYCPGPGITALVLGIFNPVLFLIGLIIGSLTYKFYRDFNQ